jgi:uncharacterized protein (TIRG00374 family)
MPCSGWGCFDCSARSLHVGQPIQSGVHLPERVAKLTKLFAKFIREKRAVATCAMVTMLSFVVGSVEVWMGLHAVGVPASFSRALVLESVGQGVQSALCLVPGALGVREGAYIVVGGLLGIPGDAAFALALIRRVREFAIGLPGLLVWQFVKGGNFWRSRILRAARAHKA